MTQGTQSYFDMLRNFGGHVRPFDGRCRQTDRDPSQEYRRARRIDQNRRWRSAIGGAEATRKFSKRVYAKRRLWRAAFNRWAMRRAPWPSKTEFVRKVFDIAVQGMRTRPNCRGNPLAMQRNSYRTG